MKNSTGFAPPNGFMFDENSGLYYMMKSGRDTLGRTGNWVTWFYPDTGEYVQDFQPDEPINQYTGGYVQDFQPDEPLNTYAAQPIGQSAANTTQPFGHSTVNTSQPDGQAAVNGGKTAGVKKKNPAVTAVIVITVLLIGAGGFFALRHFMPEEGLAGTGAAGTGLLESTLPVTENGNNRIGNSMENLQTGGFVTAQGRDVFFANFEDGGKLYMLDRDETLYKLTDFPVANLNVRGNVLFFTDLSNSSFINQQGRTQYITAYSHEDIWMAAGSKHGISYGGGLYAIAGVRSYCEGDLPFDQMEFYVFEEDYRGVQSLAFTETGLVMLAVTANSPQTKNTLVYICTDGCTEGIVRETVITDNPDESIVNYVVCGNQAFIQVRNEVTGHSYIVRYGLVSGRFHGVVEGHSLVTWLGNPVFFNPDDELLYIWDIETDTLTLISEYKPAGRIFTGSFFEELGQDNEQGLSFLTRLENGRHRRVFLVAVPDEDAESWRPRSPFVLASSEGMPVESLGVTVFAVLFSQEWVDMEVQERPHACCREDDFECVEFCYCGEECETPHNEISQDVGDEKLRLGRWGWWPQGRAEDNRDRGRDRYDEPIGPKLPPTASPSPSPSPTPPGGEEDDPPATDGMQFYFTSITTFFPPWGPICDFDPWINVTPPPQPEIPASEGWSEDCSNGMIYYDALSHEAPSYFDPDDVGYMGATKYWLFPDGTFITAHIPGDVNDPAHREEVRRIMSLPSIAGYVDGSGVEHPRAGTWERVGDTITKIHVAGPINYDLRTNSNIGIGTVNPDGSVSYIFEDENGNFVHERHLVPLICGGEIPDDPVITNQPMRPADSGDNCPTGSIFYSPGVGPWEEDEFQIWFMPDGTFAMLNDDSGESGPAWADRIRTEMQERVASIGPDGTYEINGSNITLTLNITADISITGEVNPTGSKLLRFRDLGRGLTDDFDVPLNFLTCGGEWSGPFVPDELDGNYFYYVGGSRMPMGIIVIERGVFTWAPGNQAHVSGPYRVEGDQIIVTNETGLEAYGEVSFFRLDPNGHIYMSHHEFRKDIPTVHTAPDGFDPDGTYINQHGDITITISNGIWTRTTTMNRYDETLDHGPYEIVNGQIFVTVESGTSNYQEIGRVSMGKFDGHDFLLYGFDDFRYTKQ